MLPWIHLGSAELPDGGGELRLMQRGTEYSIRLGSTELMNSRVFGSEEALATMTVERLLCRAKPHILIGGLGMGFTLRAALAVLGDDARATVVELVPAVVVWAREHMSDVFGDCLDDRRVEIRKGDVGPLIRAESDTYDAILLDVDNGPEGLTRKANDAIYSLSGLKAARKALRCGGVLAVWSSGPDTKFSRRLIKAGFIVEETRVRAKTGRRGPRHVIWFATKTNATEAQPLRGAVP